MKTPELTTEELIKRLRDYGLEDDFNLNEYCTQAATRLEELTASSDLAAEQWKTLQRICDLEPITALVNDPNLMGLMNIQVVKYDTLLDAIGVPNGSN
jgi:hypothetical protein